MVIPLRKQTADEQGRDEGVPLRYGAIWGDGAARAADARQALRAFLGHARGTDRTVVPNTLAADAELATSEMITNAILHAPGPCGMTLELTGDELTITVWDSSTEKPAPKKADPRRIGGHGMHLVHTVSDKVVVALRATGKLVTAHLSLRPDRNGPGLREAAFPAFMAG
ncbi:ATP-binding protein [Streptomyces sp. NPDC058291]|jgi:anti-sigma regulatory factor (Ser/Thr protein kinase)|uniref:ATP-binding protein n=1 Tax=Streptomyces sp. NPDC058291 TaxID=3346427 RepID=UPI0036EC4D88